MFMRQRNNSDDPIGNRVSATDYDEGGKPRTSRYTANALNQYVSRTVPGWASVRGLAATNAYISVNGNEAFTVAGRVVPNAPKYYFGSGDFDNSAQSGWAELETYATVSSATNGPDLVSAVTNRVFVPQTPETFAYDADGNMVEDGRFRYWWNGENRMLRAEEKMPPEGRTAHVVTYSYDHQGRAIYANGNCRIWDDYNIVVENATSSNVVINAWGLDIDGTMQGAGGVGGLLAVARNGDMSLPLYDANGNITEYVDSLGGVESHADYSAFGRGLMRNGVQNHSHGFSTKPQCRKSGLVEYQMRKFMPWQGRWIRRDSTFEHGGYNLYSINHNAMFSWFDFIGKAPQYIYPGVTAVYDPTPGQGEIITSHDVDFWGRIPPADYNIGLSTSFGVTISFLFGNHEFVNEDGCSFYCIGLTTQPAGVSGGVSIGNGSMVSGSVGMGWKLN